MSQLNNILSQIGVLALAADAELVIEQGVRVLSKLTSEEYPHLFIYDPSVSTELLPFELEAQTYEIQLALVTRDENQYQILERAQTIRDALRTDRDLTNQVAWHHISDIRLREDDKSTLKIADMTLSAFAQNYGEGGSLGSIFHYNVGVQLALTPTTSSSTFLSALPGYLDTGATAALPTASHTHMASDYVTNRQPTQAKALYQARVIPMGLDRAGSNDTYQIVDVGISVYKLITEEAGNELIYVNGVMAAALTKLTDTEWWRAFALIHHIISPPTVTLDGDVGREV